MYVYITLIIREERKLRRSGERGRNWRDGKTAETMLMNEIFKNKKIYILKTHLLSIYSKTELGLTGNQPSALWDATLNFHIFGNNADDDQSLCMCGGGWQRMSSHSLAASLEKARSAALPGCRSVPETGSKDWKQRLLPLQVPPPFSLATAALQ